MNCISDNSPSYVDTATAAVASVWHAVVARS